MMVWRLDEVFRLFFSALRIFFSSPTQHSGQALMRTFQPFPSIFFFLSLTCGCLTHRPLESYSLVFIFDSIFCMSDCPSSSLCSADMHTAKSLLSRRISSSALACACEC